MIQRAEQANIVGLRSKDFVQWVEENIDAPIKRGPGGAILERLKAGLVGEFFNWAKRNSTWPLHFGIMCCAIEMGATSDPRYDIERFGVIYRSSPRQCDVLLLNGPIALKLRPAVRRPPGPRVTPARESERSDARSARASGRESRRWSRCRASTASSPEHGSPSPSSSRIRRSNSPWRFEASTASIGSSASAVSSAR